MFTAQLRWLIDLKRERPNLKVLASVGGPSELIGHIFLSENMTSKFAKSCAQYVLEHRLDGIDIDWEFPREHQKDSFTQLLKVSAYYFIHLCVCHGFQS